MIKLYEKNCAIIQVDCDRDWQDANISVDILEKLLGIFESYNIKATWFAVGNDFEYAAYRDFFASLVYKKHEIGNHTYSHRKNFHLLKYGEKVYEITQCDKKIRELGFAPVGFRAPYFDADGTIFSILSTLDYKYDSSICPSPYLSLFSTVKNIMNREQVRNSFSNKRKKLNFNINGNNIKEIPVSVFPVLRFPVHASYAMILPHKIAYKYTETMISRFLHSKKPLIYVLHLNDLCPPQYFVSREFKCFMPYEKRIDFIKRVCYRIQESFEITLTKDYAKE
ncbi:MAG: polysaccharide deacetylase family protein [Clostridiales bacterium]|nr:polysaccharide deacetylase family protein [Clostridiales bacterium]